MEGKKSVVDPAHDLQVQPKIFLAEEEKTKRFSFYQTKIKLIPTKMSMEEVASSQPFSLFLQGEETTPVEVGMRPLPSLSISITRRPRST